MADFTREELAKMRALAEVGVDCPLDVVLRLLSMAERAVSESTVRTLAETTPEPVTHDEAEEIAQRFIDHFFGNKAERPRVSIPARPDYDDDIRLHAYIQQQRAARLAAKGDR